MPSLMVKKTSKTLENYLQNLSRSHPLTPAEEIALAEKMKKGDLEARDKLIQANLRFVVRVAFKFQHRGVEILDLISAGNMGLLTAAERFDPKRGYKFISYAVWWIRAAIMLSIAEQGHLVRLPINRVDLLRRISVFVSNNQHKKGRPPTEEEIAQAFDLTADQVSDTLKHTPVIFSLDKPIREHRDSLLDSIFKDNQALPDEKAEQSALKTEIREILGTLDSREEETIRLYFGLDGPEMTLNTIARRYNLTRERVRQIKEKALKKMRHPTRMEKLGAFLDAD